MADGSIIIDTHIDNEQAQKELNGLVKKIDKVQNALDAKKAEQSGIEKQLDSAGYAAEETRQKIATLNAELEKVNQTISAQNTSTVGDPATVLGAMERQTQIKAELKTQNELLTAQTKEADKLSTKYAQVAANVERTTKELNAAKAQASMLTQRVQGGSAATAAMATATATASERMAVFSKRLGAVLRSALIFTAITQAIAGLRKWLGKVIKTNDEATAAIARLKGALLTLAQPIISAVLPAFTALVNIITRLISLIGSLVSTIFGTTAAASAEAAESLYAETEALEDVGGAAKKASKQLAGFDEINQLSGDSSSAGSASGGAAIKPDFGYMDAMKDQISELEMYMSGALLALGAILTFTGVSIPLGLGLMVLGAVGLGSALAVDWNTMPENIREALTKVLVILGGGAFVLGAILAFTGAALPLGIGLMVAGAAALGSAAALNWNKIKTKIKPVLTELMVLVGSFLLILGTILACSGANLPLGIGLMAAGAVGLVGAAALNWNAVVEALRGPLGVTVALASTALLALGLILAFSGVGLPLGIALIAAGAVGLATVGALNWNAILDKIKEVWGNISNWFNNTVKPVFTKEFWTEKFSVIGESLKEKVRDGVNAAITLMNKFIDWVNDKLNISWDGLTIGGQTIIDSGNFQLLKIPPIPLLAEGAVIPPNREFMAILGDQKSGTNIETPLATMVQAFRQALNEGGYGGNHTVIMEVDGREFGRVTYNAYNSEAQRLGVSLGGA